MQLCCSPAGSAEVKAPFGACLGWPGCPCARGGWGTGQRGCMCPWLAGAWVSVCSPAGEGYTVRSGCKRRPGMGFDRLFSSTLQPLRCTELGLLHVFGSSRQSLGPSRVGGGGSCMLVSAEPSSSVPQHPCSVAVCSSCSAVVQWPEFTFRVIP